MFKKCHTSHFTSRSQVQNFRFKFLMLTETRKMDIEKEACNRTYVK